MTDTWLRANARHERDDVLTMSDLVSQNLTVQIAKTGRTNLLCRGRSEGKIQTIKLGPYPPHSLADARADAETPISGSPHRHNRITEAIISHGGGRSPLDATYDRHEYLDQKTEALSKQGDWVDAIAVDRERYLHPVTTWGTAPAAPLFLVPRRPGQDRQAAKTRRHIPVSYRLQPSRQREAVASHLPERPAIVS